MEQSSHSIVGKVVKAARVRLDEYQIRISGQSQLRLLCLLNYRCHLISPFFPTCGRSEERRVGNYFRWAILRWVWTKSQHNCATYSLVIHIGTENLSI